MCLITGQASIILQNQILSATQTDLPTLKLPLHVIPTPLPRAGAYWYTPVTPAIQEAEKCLTGLQSEFTISLGNSVRQYRKRKSKLLGR